MQINGVRANDLSFSLYRPIETAGGDEIWREYPLRRTLLKVNVEISTFRGTPQAQPRGRNISSSVTGIFVLPL